MGRLPPLDTRHRAETHPSCSKVKGPQTRGQALRGTHPVKTPSGGRWQSSWQAQGRCTTQLNPEPIATQDKACPRPVGFGGPAAEEMCSHSAARSTPRSSCLDGTSPRYRGQKGLAGPGLGSSARTATSAVDVMVSIPRGCKAGALSAHAQHHDLRRGPRPLPRS